MPVQVRAARATDRPTIVDFNARLAEESEGRVLDRSVLEAGVAALLADAEKGLYFLAEDDGEVVGQTMITYEWSDWRNGWIWWVQSVYVRADRRRGGVLRAIFAAIRERARERGVVGLRLYVERENEIAQAVYERLGFAKYHFHLYQMMFAPDEV